MRPLLCACCLLRGAESKGFGRASALLGFPRQRIEGTLFCRSQGLNRVQQAPGIAKAMAAILWRCQQRLGQWVGSSVVHLGDHNVPNALMFHRQVHAGTSPAATLACMQQGTQINLYRCP